MQKNGTKKRALICPNCSIETASDVVDSRPADGEIRRLRFCRGCKSNFTTVERVETTIIPGRKLNKPPKGGTQ